VLDHNQRALGGHAELARPRRDVLEHDLDLVNASLDVRNLAAGLGRTGSGRLCFYGPPGTGKTALAAQLAKLLGLTLQEHRASDLLGPYVGETERNIARMFARARAEKCLLLLDECDSFLRDRRGAQRSWEATLVNEMLTQVEHHEGILVCTTNLLEQIDSAALRRFDFKVEFSWLKNEQAWKLFGTAMSACGGTIPPEDKAALQAEVAELRCLTPGDFAAVMRSLSILGGAVSPSDLLELLKAEVERKYETRRKIVGFSG
jgi:SpoVK/Ycf46/Vps4 family AAA+-type ATPase